MFGLAAAVVGLGFAYILASSLRLWLFATGLLGLSILSLLFIFAATVRDLSQPAPRRDGAYLLSAMYIVSVFPLLCKMWVRMEVDQTVQRLTTNRTAQRPPCTASRPTAPHTTQRSALTVHRQPPTNRRRCSPPAARRPPPAARRPPQSTQLHYDRRREYGGIDCPLLRVAGDQRGPIRGYQYLDAARLVHSSSAALALSIHVGRGPEYQPRSAR